MDNLEVITMGRVGVDLYPEQIGATLADVRTFAKSLGGSATNVAVAAARLGRRAAVITKVGKDGFGDYVRRALAEFGVETRWVSADPTLRTPIVFCEVHPPDRFPLLFYREPKAPDMSLSYADMPLEEIVDCQLFWTTGRLCWSPRGRPAGSPERPSATPPWWWATRRRWRWPPARASPTRSCSSSTKAAPP